MANIDVDRQIYNWLMQRNFTSDERAHPLASLLQRSEIVLPDNMKRDGKLINFFVDRPNLFGIVSGSDRAQNKSIFAIVEREGNRIRGRDRHRIGRGGPYHLGFGRHEYVPSEEGQKFLNAEEDAQMVDDAILANLPTNENLEYDFSREPSSLVTFDQMAAKRAAQVPQSIDYGKYGGKKKSKSKNRSARKSRSKKNRNRRNKTARKYRKSKSKRN